MPPRRHLSRVHLVEHLVPPQPTMARRHPLQLQLLQVLRARAIKDIAGRRELIARRVQKPNTKDRQEWDSAAHA